MIRWCVAGTGGVSVLFAEAMAATDGGEIVAVASRESHKGMAFAEAHAPNAEGGATYDQLGSFNADAVYVATPPALHCEHTLTALNAGKHVLCEKPLGVSALDAHTMRDAARANGVFLMEAMWCRFLPAYARLRELLDARHVGDVISVTADFGITQPNRARPEWSAELGGGALLTGGCYAVQLVHLILGAPSSVDAVGKVGDIGVDEFSAALLHYPERRVGVVATSIVNDLACAARINGTEGVITLPSVHSPTSIEGEPFPLPAHRLLPEIEHVHRCLAEGRTESPVMSLGESVAVAETIDKIKAQL